MKHADGNPDSLNEARQKELRKFLIPKLRSASYRWKPRSDAIKAARRARGVYECNLCKCELGPKELILDHIIPVIDVREGWKNFDSFIDRLFCPIENFQVICSSCDDVKTGAEVQIRKLYRQKRKDEEK